MTMEEKDRMFNKYKYGIDHGGRIMNDMEASEVKVEKEKAVKEILSEVLNRKIIWFELRNTTLSYTYGNGLIVSEKDSMSIYELQHLCKVWVEETNTKNYYVLKSYISRCHSPVRQVGVVEVSIAHDVVQSFQSASEPDAAIQACSWIFAERKK